MSKFKILWIDDQPEKIALEKENVEKLVKEKGYTPEIDLIDKISKEDLLEDSEFLCKIKSREYDLLFIDFKLSHKVLGSHIISKIRKENKIFVDIIFYSSDKDDLIEEIVKSYNGSILEYIDDVHIIPLDDSDFYDKIEVIIDKIIGYWYNANSIRGIILSKTSKFEYSVNEIIKKYYEPLKDLIKERIIEKKENTEKEFTTKWKNCLKAEDPIKYIIDRPANFNWNIKRMMLEVLLENKVITIDAETILAMKYLFGLRNDVAHNKAKIENGILKLYKGEHIINIDETMMQDIKQKIDLVNVCLNNFLDI